ncbi:hypothetical protein PLACP1_21360 [Planifilum fimeticola]
MKRCTNGFTKEPLGGAELNGKVQGWASLNPYSHRCAYAGVVDISVYIDRSWRGKGVGSRLLRALEEKAKENGF